jgi:hypothetical protein
VFGVDIRARPGGLAELWGVVYRDRHGRRLVGVSAAMAAAVTQVMPTCLRPDATPSTLKSAPTISRR